MSILIYIVLYTVFVFAVLLWYCLVIAIDQQKYKAGIIILIFASCSTYLTMFVYGIAKHPDNPKCIILNESGQTTTLDCSSIEK